MIGGTSYGRTAAESLSETLAMRVAVVFAAVVALSAVHGSTPEAAAACLALTKWLFPRLQSERARLMGWTDGEDTPEDHVTVLKTATEVLAVLEDQDPLCLARTLDLGGPQRAAGAFLSILHHELAWRSLQVPGLTTMAARFTELEQRSAGPGYDAALNYGIWGQRLYQASRSIDTSTARGSNGQVGSVENKHAARRKVRSLNLQAFVELSQAPRTDPNAMVHLGHTSLNLLNFTQAAHAYKLALAAVAPALAPFTVDSGANETAAGLELQNKLISVALSLERVSSKLVGRGDDSLQVAAAYMERFCAPSNMSGTELTAHGANHGDLAAWEGGQRQEERYFKRASCYWTAATLRGRDGAHRGKWAEALAHYETAARRMKAASERFQRAKFSALEASEHAAESAKYKVYLALGKKDFWAEVLAAKLFYLTFHGTAGAGRSGATSASVSMHASMLRPPVTADLPEPAHSTLATVSAMATFLRRR